LKDHLLGAATRAQEVGQEFGAGRAAFLAALLHDLGKYSSAFQKRLTGTKDKVDHSTAGAQEVLNLNATGLDRHVAQLIAFGIAGHHAGLPNWSEDSPLSVRLTKSVPVDEVWKQEIKPDASALMPPSFIWERKAKDCAFQSAFLGRMIFSCLIDGDHRDTEAYFDEIKGTSTPREWDSLEVLIPSLALRFESYVKTLASTSTSKLGSPLHLLRQTILSSVRAQSSNDKGFFTLTVPTGGGKTIASLGFALDHAQKHGLKRIIYVAPFTSIIDQTARVFRDILGGDLVLEHHSAIDFEKGDQEAEFRELDDEAKLRLAMDDWAAPVIVTTSVQFFESLFANRPSKCRKLQAIANSVIIIDEAQTLPRPFLLPTLAALRELVKNYGVSIVLSTATQPALDENDLTNGGLPLQGRELAPDPANLAIKLKRTTLKRAGVLTDAQLIESLHRQDQGLVIVNTRRHALSLYRAASVAGLDGLIHLTTRQYPAHRQRIMASIRQRLTDNLPCRVIATSLVEAGVDLDFPAVWRAEAGLDQIAQAAGRCNREGKLRTDESFITVFTPAEHKTPKDIKRLAQNFETIVDEFPEDPFSPSAIRAYFKDVFWQTADDLDRYKLLEKFVINGSELDYSYKTVAQHYRLIDDSQVPIFIVREPEAIEAIAALTDPSQRPGPALRVLQRYTVQVYPKDRDLLYLAGKIAPVQSERLGDRFWRTCDLDSGPYDDQVGLVWEKADELLGDNCQF
jgi:CRISPR-associated endonuclease/helicase Cas3